MHVEKNLVAASGFETLTYGAAKAKLSRPGKRQTVAQ